MTRSTYMKFASQSVIITVALLALSACNYGGNRSGIHWFLDMHDLHSVETQEEDYMTLGAVKPDGWQQGMDVNKSWGGPGSVIRVPPKGTVPRNYEPYLFDPTDFAGAGRELKNPLSRTVSVLERGQLQYNNFCAVCHGYTGLGDGPVTPRFDNIPSVVAPKIVNWKDGELFHIITVGRARMYPYAAQINVEDRWSIIHYVRLLQIKEQAKAE